MEETVRAMIFDANVAVAAAVAFVAGVMSFASPCCLPLVPGYLSYMTGLSGQELARSQARGRLVAGSMLFVAGFAVPFTMLGVAVAQLAFLQTNPGARLVMGLVVAGMGGLLASGRSGREWRLTTTAPEQGLVGAPLLGFVFGVGWVPCIGPALAAILTLAASMGGGAAAVRGGLLAFVFALGVGLPFVLLAAAFGRAGRTLRMLKRNARRLQVFGGGLLVVVGLAIATGLWDAFIKLLRPTITAWTPPL